MQTLFEIFKPYEGFAKTHQDYFIKHVFEAQVGSENLLALSPSKVFIGPARFVDMQGMGFVLSFQETSSRCTGIGVMLWCDLYQIVTGEYVEDRYTIIVKNLISDIDCFELAPVLGRLRGIEKMPRIFRPNFGYWLPNGDFDSASFDDGRGDSCEQQTS